MKPDEEWYRRQRPLATGVTLRNLRLTNNLTQGELAAAASTATSTISRIESGDLTPKDDTKALIARAVGVSVETLWPNPQNGTQ